jgi:hypothetical protein
VTQAGKSDVLSSDGFIRWIPLSYVITVQPCGVEGNGIDGRGSFYV